MIVKEIIGNVNAGNYAGLPIDTLAIEWYESTKRIQRLVTDGGKDIAIRLLGAGQYLKEGDVLVQNEEGIIVVRIKPCEVIVIQPKTMPEIGAVCFEIGNKHLPLFIQGEEVLMPFERAMFRWLEINGYQPVLAERKLMNMLQANVDHSQHRSTTTKFTKIMNLDSIKG